MLDLIYSLYLNFNVSEVEKITNSLYKKSDCGHCDDLNTFNTDIKDKLTVPMEYETVDLDSDLGKEWTKTNTSDVPASKICVQYKDGKKDCNTITGVDEAKAFISKYTKK